MECGERNECLAQNIWDKMHFSLRRYALQMLWHSGSVQFVSEDVKHSE